MELQVEAGPTAQRSTSVLCDSLRVALTVHAVTTDLVETLTGLAAPRLQTALLSGSNGGVVGRGRTCQITWFSHGESPVVRTIVDIVAAVAGLPSHRAERLQVIRYSQGGEYKPHLDSYDLDSERGRRCTAGRGQRHPHRIALFERRLCRGRYGIPSFGPRGPSAPGRRIDI
jgi:prolyl 4-hydroxylase